MNEEIKDIFECLRKYANLTPDAIDDLYYLEGYIEDLQQENNRLNNIINELKNQNAELNKQITAYQDEIFGLTNNWYDMQN